VTGMKKNRRFPDFRPFFFMLPLVKLNRQFYNFAMSSASLFDDLKKFRYKKNRQPESGRLRLPKPEAGQLYKYRAVAKCYIYKATSARYLVSYMTQEGKGRHDKEPELFTKEGDTTKSFFKRQREAEKTGRDKTENLFRFILSPENGSKLNLEAYTKKVMADLEHHLLGRDLVWVASAHHDTENPHVHILIRGVDREKRKVIINRDIIKKGFRELAEKESFRELGYKARHDYLRRAEEQVRREKVIARQRSACLTLAGEIAGRLAGSNYSVTPVLEKLGSGSKENLEELLMRIKSGKFKIDFSNKEAVTLFGVRFERTEELKRRKKDKS
jgi:hypothetical protein